MNFAHDATQDDVIESGAVAQRVPALNQQPECEAGVTKNDQLRRMAARGWRLFPVKQRGKKPLIDDWPNQATNDEARLRSWLRRFSNCSWGVATGPGSGVFVLDVDGEEGLNSLVNLEHKACKLPQTLTTRTGRGSHLWLAWPTNGTVVRNSAGKLAPGLDVRGEGGYVVVPPSVHPSGTPYDFADEQVPVAPVPEWLLERIAQGSTAPDPHDGTAAQPQGDAIPEGQRNDVLTSLAGAMRRKGMTPGAIKVALLEENRARCSPPLGDAEVVEIAESISRYEPASPSPRPDRRRPDLLKLSQVEAREVDWLWKPYLASGMLAMLSGDPGAGKTFIGLAISADATTGRVPSTGEPCPPGDVLYLSLENSPPHVLRPRFDSLGGDPSRFHLLRGSVTGEGDRAERSSVRLSDVRLLSDALHQTNARLVIVDPIQSYLGAEVDAHRSNETRPVMDGLSRLAEEHACCILLVRHLGKAPTGKAIHRGLGSIDLTGAVRTELLAGCSPDDPAQRALVQVKSNLGPFGPSLGYTIEGDGKFRWTGETQLTASEILAAEGGETGATAEAEAFLLGTLAQGARLQKDVENEARQHGVSERTLIRAKKKLGVRSRKTSMNGPWEWSLPEGGQQ